MNISQKCNCCVKESVCIYTESYKYDCERVKNFINNSPIEISIKCKEFVTKSMTLTRELQNENN